MRGKFDNGKECEIDTEEKEGVSKRNKEQKRQISRW